MAKIRLTLSQYHHILEHSPWVPGDIKDVEGLLLKLQDHDTTVAVTQDDREIMRLEFDPQETNQIKEVTIVRNGLF